MGDPIEKIQGEFSAMTIEEYKMLANIGVSEDVIRVQNDQKRKVIEERVAEFIPVPDEATSASAQNAVDILNIVLLGKSGSGKSELGNLLLELSEAKEKKFETSSSINSCTQTIKILERDCHGLKIRVADTPGTFDTKATEDDIATEILKVGLAFKEGIHIFLFVRSLGNVRFTEEEMKAFQAIKEMFSDSVLSHCAFLYTHAGQILKAEDCKVKSIRGYIDHSLSKSGERSDVQRKMMDIYNSVDDRVIAVESKPTTHYEREIQRKLLIKYLQSTVEKKPATRKVFTCENFEKAKDDYNKRKEKEQKKLSLQKKKVPTDAIKAMIDKTVSNYLESKTNSDMKGMLSNVKSAVEEIVADNTELEDYWAHVKSALVAKAEVLTNESHLAGLKRLAVGFFTAAGSVVLDVAKGLVPVVVKFLGKKILGSS